MVAAGGQGTLTIAEAAARTGLTAHTLRYYERASLLDPIARASSGHRRYTTDDLDWIAFLQRLRATGMPIRQMRRYAALRRAGGSTLVERRQMLEQHRTELRARVRTLRRGLDAIDEKITTYRSLEASHDDS